MPGSSGSGARSFVPRGARCDDLRAAAFGRTQILEQLDAGLAAFDDDTLEQAAEQPGHGRGELFRHLDAIGDEAEHARVVLAEQGARARADAFETAMQIFERAETAARQRQLVLRDVDGALAVEEARLEPQDLALERLALGRGDALAVRRLGDRTLERLFARARVGALAFERLALRDDAVAPGSVFVETLRESVDARGLCRDAGAELAGFLPELQHLGRGGRFLLVQSR